MTDDDVAGQRTPAPAVTVIEIDTRDPHLAGGAGAIAVTLIAAAGRRAGADASIGARHGLTGSLRRPAEAIGLPAASSASGIGGASRPRSRTPAAEGCSRDCAGGRSRR